MTKAAAAAAAVVVVIVDAFWPKTCTATPCLVSVVGGRVVTDAALVVVVDEKRLGDQAVVDWD